MGVWWCLTHIWICISVMAYDAGCLFTCVFAICISLLRCLFGLWFIWKSGWFFSYCWVLRGLCLQLFFTHKGFQHLYNSVCFLILNPVFSSMIKIELFSVDRLWQVDSLKHISIYVNTMNLLESNRGKSWKTYTKVWQ